MSPYRGVTDNGKGDGVRIGNLIRTSMEVTS